MAGRWLRATGVIAALVLFSGCAATVTGTPRAPAGADRDGRATETVPRGATPGGYSTAELLGELTTIDPCSLTDTRALAGFGSAKLAAPDSLDDCLIEITTSAPEPVALYVGGLDRSESWPELAGKKTTARTNGLRVVEYQSDSSYCNHLLVFPDGITLSVNASVYNGTETRLCAMVAAAMDTVVEVLAGGKVEHRDFAANSLGRVDPCELVPDAALAAVPGLGAAPPRDYPGRHGCAWTAADNTVRVRLMVTTGPPPKPAGQGATESRIAGRDTVLSPTPEAGNFVFCGQQTGHIPFRAEGGSGLVEIAAVFVRMREGQLDAACAAATDVATAVWPQLPRP